MRGDQTRIIDLSARTIPRFESRRSNQPLAALSVLRRRRQIVEADLERAGDRLQRLDRSDALAVLEVREIALAQASGRAELVERHLAVLAPDADRALAGEQAFDHLDRHALLAGGAGMGLGREVVLGDLDRLLDQAVEIAGHDEHELGEAALMVP